MHLNVKHIKELPRNLWVKLSLGKDIDIWVLVFHQNANIMVDLSVQRSKRLRGLPVYEVTASQMSETFLLQSAKLLLPPQLRLGSLSQSRLEYASLWMGHWVRTIRLMK